MSDSQALRPRMILSDKDKDNFHCFKCGTEFGAINLAREINHKQTCSECGWQFILVPIELKAMVKDVEPVGTGVTGTNAQAVSSGSELKKGDCEGGCLRCTCADEDSSGEELDDDDFDDDDDDDFDDDDDDEPPPAPKPTPTVPAVTSSANAPHCGNCGYPVTNCRCDEFEDEDDDDDDIPANEDVCEECGWHLDDCICDLDDEESEEDDEDE